MSRNAPIRQNSRSKETTKASNTHKRELSSSDGKKIIILKASLDYEMSPREPKATMNGNNPKPKEIHTPASKKTLKLQQYDSSQKKSIGLSSNEKHGFLEETQLSIADEMNSNSNSAADNITSKDVLFKTINNLNKNFENKVKTLSRNSSYENNPFGQKKSASKSPISNKQNNINGFQQFGPLKNPSGKKKNMNKNSSQPDLIVEKVTIKREVVDLDSDGQMVVMTSARKHKPQQKKPTTKRNRSKSDEKIKQAEANSDDVQQHEHDDLDDPKLDVPLNDTPPGKPKNSRVPKKAMKKNKSQSEIAIDYVMRNKVENKEMIIDAITPKNPRLGSTQLSSTMKSANKTLKKAVSHNDTQIKALISPDKDISNHLNHQPINPSSHVLLDKTPNPNNQQTTKATRPSTSTHNKKIPILKEDSQQPQQREKTPVHSKSSQQHSQVRRPNALRQSQQLPSQNAYGLKSKRQKSEDQTLVKEKISESGLYKALNQKLRDTEGGSSPKNATPVNNPKKATSNAATRSSTAKSTSLVQSTTSSTLKPSLSKGGSSDFEKTAPSATDRENSSAVNAQMRAKKRRERLDTAQSMNLTSTSKYLDAHNPSFKRRSTKQEPPKKEREDSQLKKMSNTLKGPSQRPSSAMGSVKLGSQQNKESNNRKIESKENDQTQYNSVQSTSEQRVAAGGLKKSGLKYNNTPQNSITSNPTFQGSQTTSHKKSIDATNYEFQPSKNSDFQFQMNFFKPIEDEKLDEFIQNINTKSTNPDAEKPEKIRLPTKINTATSSNVHSAAQSHRDHNRGGNKQSQHPLAKSTTTPKQTAVTPINNKQSSESRPRGGGGGPRSLAKSKSPSRIQSVSASANISKLISAKTSDKFDNLSTQTYSKLDQILQDLKSTQDNRGIIDDLDKYDFEDLNLADDFEKTEKSDKGLFDDGTSQAEKSETSSTSYSVNKSFAKTLRVFGQVQS